MPDDLISRQAAIDLISQHTFYNDYDGTDKCSLVDGLRELPSAQPEIIRCKDCKYIQRWRSEESAKKFDQIYECARNVFDLPKPDDFCSHVERRSNE